MLNYNETTEQVLARIEAEKATKRAEFERTLEPIRAQAAEHRAAKAAAKAKAQQAKEEARQQEAAAKFDKEHKAAALSTWIANGGTAAEFDNAWPQLRQGLLVEATRKATDKAKAATARQMHQSF